MKDGYVITSLSQCTEEGCFQDMSPVIQGCKWTRSCIP